MPPRSPVPSRDLLLTLYRLAFPTTSTSIAPTCAKLPFHRHPLPIKSTGSALHRRPFSTSSPRSGPPQDQPLNRYAPKTHDRGPASEEDTQTDFSTMDIFNSSATPTPATSIDACTADGFHLNNGVKTTAGKGVLLVGGECFLWTVDDPSPSTPSSTLTSTEVSSAESSSIRSPNTGQSSGGARTLLDARGTLSLPPSSLSLLSLLYPKPDLLLLGTGAKLQMLSKATRAHISELGMRVDVMDTGNASAAYNLLAQERGVEGGGGVGALMLPLGWTG